MRLLTEKSHNWPAGYELRGGCLRPKIMADHDNCCMCGVEGEMTDSRSVCDDCVARQEACIAEYNCWPPPNNKIWRQKQ